MAAGSWEPSKCDLWLDVPEPDVEYLHYKGGLYKVLAVGRLSEARDQVMVVYASKATGEVWIRPFGMFTEQLVWADGGRRPRFTRLDFFEGEDIQAVRAHTLQTYQAWPDGL